MREKLEVPVKSLSEAEVAQLTNLLSRRPTYGIARPSGKWLSRQQDKMEGLSETLLEPKNPLQRKFKKISVGARQLLGDLQLARPLAERAVLCGVHERLNSFVLRELFWLLFLEIGSHLDPLRAWPHKSPTVAHFLTRCDSISALVMSKEFFIQRFKAAPHDERFVRVESECEACVLAAVGGNGRCLADLYAALKLREDHSRSMSAHSRKRAKTPRLMRFVSHWIRSMAEPHTVYAWAEEVLAEIRPLQREIKRNWRDRRRSKHTSKSKSQARHTVSLPRAQEESESMDQRRVAALYRQGMGQAQSVYREDSLANEPMHGAPAHHQTSGPGTATNPPSDERGEDTSTGTDAEMLRSVYDDSWDHEFEYPLDLEPDERGADYRAEDTQDRVGDWYSQVGGGGGGAEAAEDELHPALRPTTRQSKGFTHPSAVPPPLHPAPPASSYVGARGGWRHQPPSSPDAAGPQGGPPAATRDQDARTEWTDLTVHTWQGPRAAAPSAPPVPPVPPRYREGQADAAAAAAAPDAPPPPRTESRLSQRPDGASTPRRGASSRQQQQQQQQQQRTPRSPLVPPPTPPPTPPPPPSSSGGSAISAANLRRMDAEEQRKWERETSGPADSVVHVHDSISCVAPPAGSEMTTLSSLMRRHRRGG